MSSSFADGAEVPVTEAALQRWTATLRRWKVCLVDVTWCFGS